MLTEEALISSPSLFYCSFPKLSDTVRLDFGPAGPENYIEVDAVMLIGASSVNIARLRSQQVTYIQDLQSDFYFDSNVDSLSFTIDDREYYMKYRNIDISEGVITLDISPVNDAPTTSNKTVEINGTTTQIKLQAIDADGPDNVTISITELPSFGSLFSLNGYSIKKDAAVGSHLFSSVTCSSHQTL